MLRVRVRERKSHDDWHDNAIRKAKDTVKCLSTVVETCGEGGGSLEVKTWKEVSSKTCIVENK